MSTVRLLAILALVFAVVSLSGYGARFPLQAIALLLLCVAVLLTREGQA